VDDVYGSKNAYDKSEAGTERHLHMEWRCHYIKKVATIQKKVATITVRDVREGCSVFRRRVV
jgi:hypothetical protein